MDSKENILFSVIIPTYNRAHLIGKAIESVLGQTYPHWELIIVDDGSTDNTREVVAGYDDGRIRYYYKENEERSIARNFGIDAAKGMYICFMDDDDYYLSDFMEEFFHSIKGEEYPVAVIMSREYRENEVKKTPLKLPDGMDKNPVRAIWNSQPGMRQMAIHRNILQSERFDKRFHFGQDFHLIIRIALKHPFHIIDKALCVYVEHSDRGSLDKFKRNIRHNALSSIDCIEDLINTYEGIAEHVPQNEISDVVNHKVYGFASAAMKKYDHGLFRELFARLRYDGSKLRTGYYLISLLLRRPFYIIRKILR